MSAYMMDKEDIDRIITVAVYGPSDALKWESRLVATQADDAGDMLIRENLSSIHYRYPYTITNPEGTPGPIAQYWLIPYVFVKPSAQPTRADAIAILRSYEYQSCEHPEWETSDARILVTSLRRLLEACELKPQPIQPRLEVKHYSITETAQIIKAELRKAFPETKFSVRSKSYSGSSHISVHYADGPPTKAVEGITNDFYGTGFDGMTDSSTYHDSTWNGLPAHFAGSRPSVSRSFTGESITNEFGRSVSNPNGPAPKVEALLREKINFDDRNYDLPSRYTWAVLGSWDARWETLERAVERFVQEGCKTW